MISTDPSHPPILKTKHLGEASVTDNLQFRLHNRTLKDLSASTCIPGYPPGWTTGTQPIPSTPSIHYRPFRFQNPPSPSPSPYHTLGACLIKSNTRPAVKLCGGPMFVYYSHDAL
ncbi:hypothetical protein BDV12DRAFT_181199 [Aspergillus spectabilis]